MTTTQDTKPRHNVNNILIEEGNSVKRVQKIFHWISRIILVASSICIIYCIFSSDRYVSESTVLIQNTEQITTSTIDVTTLLSNMVGPNKSDQLLLSEYLLSVDMLKKLDKNLNLRAHYADNKWDIASRMWFGKYYMEWFHRYYLSHVNIRYDELSGVLHIEAQAYDPKIAHSIVQLLVTDGEWFMNDMGHVLAREQVKFLEKQVAQAQDEVLLASKALLTFQNQKGLISPTSKVESIHSIIAKLEGQRTELQTQLASLPHNINSNHPTKQSLQQSIIAIERQISQEQERLASTNGKPLNCLMEQEQILQLELKFKQDIYKTSLIALEKGRMDAVRSLKVVSVLQQPTIPEYALKPSRIYGIVSTLCITLLVLGITNLLKSIILDHVD